jgi:hypothetical protein
MSEKIISIEEVFGHKPDLEECKDPVDASKLGFARMLLGAEAFDGILIKTTEQKIFVGVNDDPSCCESWGYVTSSDNPKRFVGSKILGIRKVDEALKSTDIALKDKYLDEGGVMFVNVDTSLGLFQIAAYNSHNGYYGHTAVLVSKQLSANMEV